MKYTLFLTHSCNLACSYCYVSKSKDRMSLDIAQTVIDFAYRHTPPGEDIDIGFFGGEPLLEFPLLKEITGRVRAHPEFDPCRVKLGLATNATLFTPEILDFLRRNEILATVSCDGPPAVQDRYRRFANGAASSPSVEAGLRMALERLPHVPVNAVFAPDTLGQLPETIDYFSSLGIREIYLNPDFSAHWGPAEVERLPGIYESITSRYIDFYRRGRPHYISLIDVKITVILRGGYQPSEHCRMGEREFAFTASGRVLPCERLASADPEEHTIGSANGLVQIGPLRDHFAPGPPLNEACLKCTVKDYCTNWCGCSNFFMTGHYNRVSPFLCISERASIQLAMKAMETVESELGPVFVNHLGGRAHLVAFRDAPSEDEAPSCQGHLRPV